MISIDEYQLLAEQAADELPEGMLPELNGGIIVVDRVELHEKSTPEHPMYVLGAYKNQFPGLGRVIYLYYGSFVKMYPSLDTASAFPKIREVLFHEITHYLETLARDTTLLDKDSEDIAKMMSSFKNNA